MDSLASEPTEAQLRHHYGNTAVTLGKFVFHDTFQLVTLIDKHIFARNNDEEVIRFRDSSIDNCNMTSVAGAVIASIAITAFSLPSLSQTHWVARAFWIVSLVTGCLSVFYAYRVQRTLSLLWSADEIRVWLTSVRLKDSLSYQQSRVSTGFKIVRSGFSRSTMSQSGSEHDHALRTDVRGIESGEQQAAYKRQTLALENKRLVSLTSAFLLNSPGGMINLSLGSFVLGLGVYLGFLWTRGLDTDAGPDDSRNNFIVYIASVLIIPCLYGIPSVLKNIEDEAMKSFSETPRRLENSGRNSQVFPPRTTASNKLTFGLESPPGRLASDKDFTKQENLKEVLLDMIRAQEASARTIQELAAKL